MDIEQLRKARWGTHDTARAAIKHIQENWDALSADDKALLISEYEWANRVAAKAIKSDKKHKHPDLDTDADGITIHDIWVDADQWMRKHIDNATIQALHDRPWDQA